jgi:hypothetical protein
VQQGIGIEFKYKSGSKEIQGVSFSLGEYIMKGSAIDRTCSYKNLNDFLMSTTLANQIRAAMDARTQDAQIVSKAMESVPTESAGIDAETGSWLDLFGDIGYAFGAGDDEDDDAKKRRKQGMSR